MAETTPFTIGADAIFPDGACGKLRGVVVDPGGHPPAGRAAWPWRHVPLGLADAASGEVRLGCTLAEFEPAETTEFLPGSHQDTGYPPHQVLTLLYYGLTTLPSASRPTV